MSRNLHIYSVRDSKASHFAQPFFSLNHRTVKRSVCDAIIKGTDTDLVRHPEDFAVFALGEFDPDTGVITVHAQPECLYKCHELVSEIREAQALVQPDLPL
jgi:hypothetical protein